MLRWQFHPVCMWHGEYSFLLRNLVLKDFRVRYRNMSLGMLWSLLNPLVMMAVLTFVFVKVIRTDTPNFPVFVLCGLVPFNFFSAAWISATTSLVDNAGLIRYVNVPRAAIPLSSVLSACPHLLIQLFLLLLIALLSGLTLNIHWLWLPLVLFLEIIFLFGLGMLSAVLNVYVRDTRYVVESAVLVLFYLVPIFYPFAVIPDTYKNVYQYNPLAALVLALREVVLEARPVSHVLLLKLLLVSCVTCAAGWIAFRRLEPRLYDHL